MIPRINLLRLLWVLFNEAIQWGFLWYIQWVFYEVHNKVHNELFYEVFYELFNELFNEAIVHMVIDDRIQSAHLELFITNRATHATLFPFGLYALLLGERRHNVCLFTRCHQAGFLGGGLQGRRRRMTPFFAAGPFGGRSWRRWGLWGHCCCSGGNGTVYVYRVCRCFFSYRTLICAIL